MAEDDLPRVDFHYLCACGKQIKGWALGDSVADREVAGWRRNHEGEGHTVMAEAEYRKGRRGRRR